MESSHTPENGPDPLGLRHLGSAAYAIFRVAVDTGSRPPVALNRSEALICLRRLAPGSTFHQDYVVQIALKLIDRKGHGANSERLKGPELAQFRREYPQYAMLTDGLALFLVACAWWIQEKGGRAMQPGMPLVTTSDLDRLLWKLGFLQRERAAIARIIVQKRNLR